MDPNLVSVAYAAAEQQRAALFQAIQDWAHSTGAEHVRDRHWAMDQFAVRRARIALRQAEVAAAIQRNQLRRIAA